MNKQYYDTFEECEAFAEGLKAAAGNRSVDWGFDYDDVYWVVTWWFD